MRTRPSQEIVPLAQKIVRKFFYRNRTEEPFGLALGAASTEGWTFGVMHGNSQKLSRHARINISHFELPRLIPRKLE
jgi:hypothetical protein